MLVISVHYRLKCAQSFFIFLYSKSYIRDEESFIKTRCKELLDRYYERKGHEKRAIGVSKVSSMFSSDKKIEILISEELAASVLQGCFPTKISIYFIWNLTDFFRNFGD